MMREVLSERHEMPGLDGGWVPFIDVYEKDNELIVETEVPGLSAKEIVISLFMSRIEIKGIKKEGPVQGSIKYLRLEREYGAFRRIIPLPCAVYPEKAKAYLENGILTINLKKLKETKDKEVVVKIIKSSDSLGGKNG